MNSSADLDGLSKKERRQLFRVPSASPLGASWLGIEARRGNPLARALRAGWQGTAEGFRQYAAALLSLGEREEVLSAFYERQFEGPHVVQELAEFVTTGDFEQTIVWIMKLGSAWVLGNAVPPGSELAAGVRDRWSGDIWSEDDDRAYRNAFAEGRLSAFLVQHGVLLLVGQGQGEYELDESLYEPDAGYLMGGVLRRLDVRDRPNLEALEPVGKLLVAEAERGGFLRPALELCRTHCPRRLSQCMYSAVWAPVGSAVRRASTLPLNP